MKGRDETTNPVQNYQLEENDGQVAITWAGKTLTLDSRKVARQLAEIDKKHQTGPNTYNELARWDDIAQFVDALRGDPPGTCSQSIAEQVYGCVVQAANAFGEEAKKKLTPPAASLTGTAADPIHAGCPNGNGTPGLETSNASTPSGCCGSAT